MSSLALQCLPVFMRQGRRKGKGQRVVKVLDVRPEMSFSTRRCCLLIANWSVSSFWSCVVSEVKFSCQHKITAQSVIVPIVFTTLQERKWNMHVFTRPKTKTKMNDNSSIVAWGHILDTWWKMLSFPTVIVKLSKHEIYHRKCALQSKGQELIGC